MKKKLPNQDYIQNLKRIIHKREFNSSSRLQYQYFRKKKFTFDKKSKLVIEGQSGISSIRDICLREGISPKEFYTWTKEILSEESKKENTNVFLSDDDRYRIVLEGSNGEYSVAEICRKEKITQEQFLQWSAEFLKIRNRRLKREKEKDERTTKQKEKIIIKAGEEALLFFESYLDVTSENTSVFTDQNLCLSDEINNFENIVCLQKVNDIRYINKHFELINSKMSHGGVLIGCMESFSARRSRMKIDKFPVLNEIYFGIEFLIMRVLPKLGFTKKYFFDITKGKDRLLSKAEGLGRLVSCGFKIMDYKSINGLIYFVVKKEREPDFNKNPSYGPLYKMPRIGKNGKIIKVYKLRTMHPYSEYIQDYVLKAYGYSESGKPANDFRIPKWGRFMRRFWLDEFPQLINVLKGEMKLVGIRPVSERYFQDIPREMQKLRMTQKPGCIPPYVALNRDGNVMSVLRAEKDYLNDKIKHPHTTDIKYFFKAIYNILFRHKRSA